MKRKSILGLPVFLGNNNEEIGVIKEVMINKNDFKIDFYIVLGSSIDESYMVPFLKTMITNNKLITENKEDFLELDSFILYNEIKRNGTIFVEKNVIDQEGNHIGKIYDYDFDDITGTLESIVYINKKTGREESVKYTDIVDTTKDNISVYMENKNMDDFSKAQNYFGDIIKDAKENSNQTEEFIDMEEVSAEYIKSLDKIVNEYESIIKEKRNGFVIAYEQMEKDVVAEYDNIIAAMKIKRDELFNKSIKELEKNYVEEIKKIKEEKIKEIKMFPINAHVSKAQEMQEEIVVEKESNEDKKIAINSPMMDSPKTNKKEDTTTKIDLTSKDETFSFDNNNELERLYELQRKRMNILKKL